MTLSETGALMSTDPVQRDTLHGVFERQVRDALLHLHDPAYLQTHPLTSLFKRGPESQGRRAGGALRDALIWSVDALRPKQDVAADAGASRCCRLLTMRYVDGLSVEAVQQRLALSRSAYFRDHQRALQALCSLLRERWDSADAENSRSMPDAEPHAGIAAMSEHDAQTAVGVSTTSVAPSGMIDSQRRQLPIPLTSFLGRDDDMAEIKRLLTTTRLLTLTGAPGSGKTRLAQEVVSGLSGSYRDGVSYVPMAPIRQPELVVPTIAHAFGVREVGSLPIIDSLKNFLRDKHVLLVLDNFEQIVSAAPLVVEVLAACPRITTFVTSRVPLHVRGEREYHLEPLAIPDREPIQPIEQVATYPAVALFVERARDVASGFVLTDDNAFTIAAICHRLDGLPLAIELAAARVRVLSLQSLLERLERRLPLLTGGAQDLPVRHQTLRAAIAWSYDLLDEGEKSLFRRLSVFAGGCTLEAAEAVCADDGGWRLGVGGWIQDRPFANPQPLTPNPRADILDRVQSLVSKSLLRRMEVGGEARFLLLETLWEYGAEQLVACRELDAMRDRHADYYLDLAERAEPELKSVQPTSCAQCLEQELDSFRAALEWLTARGDAERGLRLAGALWQFWNVRGHWTEGRERLQVLLVLPEALEPTAARAKALYGAGALALYQADYAAAHRWLEECLTICQGLQDRHGTAWSLIYLAWLANDQGDNDAAHRYAQEGLGVCRELGDPRGVGRALSILGLTCWFEGDIAAAQPFLEESVAANRNAGDTWGTGWALHMLGGVLNGLGDSEFARSVLEESLEIWRATNEKRQLGYCLNVLGKVSVSQGDFAAARARSLESLLLFEEIGDRFGTACTLQGCGQLAAALGRYDSAVRLAAASSSIYEAIGTKTPPIHRASLDRYVTVARQALGEDAVADAWAAGNALTLEQAVVEARTDETSLN